jgi:hypothetical protein
MKEKITRQRSSRLSLFFLACLLPGVWMFAQQQDTLNGRHIYKPQQSENRDTIRPTAPTPEQLHHF